MTGFRALLAPADTAGVVLGVIYSLSPATVLSLAALTVAAFFAGRGLTPRERRWFLGLVIAATVLRLAAIAGLFLIADPAQPHATFFGDEQLFKNRSMWIRNIGMGIPISPADVIYAFEEVAETSYLFILAFLQALVGPMPYGVHVMNSVSYTCAVLAMYRLTRSAYGAVPAMSGLGLLLFLPSLFVWSISALKEPLYTLIAVGELWCALQVIRARSWSGRAGAAAGLIAGIIVLESVRRGGGAAASLGALAGIVLGYSATRPRMLLAVAVGTPVVAAIALATPAVQQRLLQVGRVSVNYHIGHVVSLGHSYQLIEPRYYRGGAGLAFEMPPREVAAYAVKSVANYAVQPLPWRAPSPAILAYMPEQMLWLMVLAFVPAGVLAGLRRDAPLTTLIACHAGAVMMMVALTSGNIGTLIRHRGLALPYLAWLAGLGVWTFATTVTSRPRSLPEVRGGASPGIRSTHGNR